MASFNRNEDYYLTAEALARVLSVPPEVVRRLQQDGYLTPREIKGSFYFPLSASLEILQDLRRQNFYNQTGREGVVLWGV